MNVHIGTHPLKELLDARAVSVLFEGHASLEGEFVVCDDTMTEFVVHRLELLETEVRIRQGDRVHITWSVPAHDLVLDVEVPQQLFTVNGLDESLIHATYQALRWEGRYSEAERVDAITPELKWYLMARRYLDVKRRLNNMLEVLQDLERSLYPQEVAR